MARVSLAPAPSLRDAMRHLVSGVCVVTAGLGEDRTGMTVTSATSLSVDPPTIIVGINRSSSVWQQIQRYRHFCVNILADHHKEIAERFAGRGGVNGAARYTGANWSELVTGAPALDGALAAIDCVFESHIDWHTHVAVLGSVKTVQIGSGDALVYSHRQYGSYSAARLDVVWSSPSSRPAERN